MEGRKLYSKEDPKYGRHITDCSTKSFAVVRLENFQTRNSHTTRRVKHCLTLDDELRKRHSHFDALTNCRDGKLTIISLCDQIDT